MPRKKIDPNDPQNDERAEDQDSAMEDAAENGTLPEEDRRQTCTPAELMAVRHLGPGIIGAAMFEAAQAYTKKTDNGIFGPAIVGE